MSTSETVDNQIAVKTFMKTPEQEFKRVLQQYTGVSNVSFSSIPSSNKNFTIHCMEFDTDGGTKEFGIETFSTYQLDTLKIWKNSTGNLS